MKKVLIAGIVLLILVAFSLTAYADSPLTSTGFYTAYSDIGIVAKAEAAGAVNSEIAQYLADASNPMDVKAAVINAFGFAGKNADLYAKQIYGKSANELNPDQLSGQELLCIGYMTAMDDYFHPEKALPYMEKASEKIKDSYTVSIITALVKAQIAMNEDWTNVWKAGEEVVNNEALKMDFRVKAAKIIVDYLSLYSDDPVTNPYDGDVAIDPPAVTVEVGKLFTAKISEGTEPYQLSSTCDYADVTISGSTVTVKGKKAGTGTVEITDKDDLSISLPIVVTPAAVENPKIEIILHIGDPTMTVNNVKSEIDPGKGTAPQLKDGSTILPIRAIVEALGGTVGWEQTEKKLGITLGTKEVALWLDKDTAMVNGQEKKLAVAPQIINSRTMLPLRFVSENLGCDVSWDGATQKITITFVKK